MKPFETIYLGCDSSEGIAKPNESLPVRFCWATMYSHATFVNTVSSAFAQVQLIHQESGYTNGPAKVAVYYTKPDHKKKAEDTETIHERVKWFFQALQEPECGMVVSFYELPDGKEHVVIPFLIANYWPTKMQWKPKNEYISIQYMQPGVGGPKAPKVYSEIPGFYEEVQKEAEKYGLDVKWIDYTMPYQETLEILAGSNMHFSYCGATMYLAACVGVPVVAWPYYEKRFRLGSYYDYDTKERINVMSEQGQWGKVTSNTVRLLRWDPERKVATNKPEDYINYVYDHDELRNFFKYNAALYLDKPNP